jgi:hypothetical protein
VLPITVTPSHDADGCCSAGARGLKFDAAVDRTVVTRSPAPLLGRRVLRAEGVPPDTKRVMRTMPPRRVRCGAAA